MNAYPLRWQSAWDHPTADLRPLQIVHSPDNQDLHELTKTLKARGLGGIVAECSTWGHPDFRPASGLANTGFDPDACLL